MSAAAGAWTCPFCPLSCDRFGIVVRDDGALALDGSDCPRALAALQAFSGEPSSAGPALDGRPCDLDTAAVAAARLLAASRQPLFGGLATDVAGARALFALAQASGAICDAAGGAALTEAVRATQDRGGFTATLAEVKTRGDLLVCFGGLPTARHPEFLRRIGWVADDPRLVVIADADGDDRFEAAALLAAAVEGRVPDALPPALQRLAERLRGAHYAVIVYETARLGVHGALVIEMLQRTVSTLNRHTRAAALALGGGDGAATANQVFTWLSGLPLRQRAGPFGLEHDPLCFDTGRLLADGAADLLLWVSSFGAEPAPPAAALPRIVLGHPALAGCGAEVFIPVATPGIGMPGHGFRTDGVVLMPLHAVRAERLPALADVLGRIGTALRAARPA
jgi:formylmethanofuran dehydrogenase subunit B